MGGAEMMTLNRGFGSIDPSGALSDPTISALLSCGFCPSNVSDLDHSSWNTANGVTTDPMSFLSIYNAGLACSGPPKFTNLSQCPASSGPVQPPQLCPSGWSGTFPACVPPSTLPAGTVYSSPTPTCPPGTQGTYPQCVFPTSLPSDQPPNPMASTIINSSGYQPSYVPVESGNWLTESMLFGLPNWVLALGAGAGLYLAVMGGHK